jgi:electron transfer flavoprotein alpha subunit
MKALVFSEFPETAAQMVTYLRKLGEADAATLSSKADALKEYGAGKVYALNGQMQSDNVSAFLAETYKSGGYDYIFVASTILGREVAGAVSQSLDVDITSEIVEFQPGQGNVHTKRNFLGGKTVLEEESESRVFTFAPGIVDAEKAGSASEVASVELKPSAVTVASVEEKQTSGVNLEKAKIIVSIGRGVGKKENIAQVEPLVKAVNGELAGSRPVCLDYQWLSDERQVGISGKKVRPNVYIAVGISGQIQHIAGMRGSKIVVALNKDKTAPIFDESDYGIVGDLFQIVPKLVQALGA